MANKIIRAAVGVIRNPQQQILVALRPPQVYMPGLWEFPGGKIEEGEDVLAALTRELQEELDITITRATPLTSVTYDYPDRKVLLDVWQVTNFSGNPHGKEGQQIKWVEVAELRQLEFPSANYAIIDIIEAL